MKKKIITLTVMGCMTVMNVNAQVYGGDTWVQFPTRDLYDSQTMNMALQHAEMAARVRARKEAMWEQYSDLAYENYNNRQWNRVISSVNLALETGFYNSDVYYMRGYAYEQLGYFKQAKKDYRKAKKYGSYQAVSALDALKEKMKKR